MQVILNESNKVLIRMKKFDVLFSYKTPVAISKWEYDVGTTWFITDKKYSNATTRHINSVIKDYHNQQIIDHNKLLKMIEKI